MNNSSSQTHYLLRTTSETAYLDFYLRLHEKVLDSEVKCYLSKQARGIASDISAADNFESPLLGPSSLGDSVSTDVAKALSKYESTKIEQYAANCVSTAKLYNYGTTKDND